MNGLTIKNLGNLYISGTGTAFPPPGKWMTNEAIHELIFGPEWQQKMAAKKMNPLYYEQELGFQARYWAHTPGSKIVHGELTSADLMVEAAKNAIADSGMQKEEIDFVIAVTITSPRYSTSMGPYISGKLGITAPSMEMKAGCASNLFSITLAAQMIQSGARNVLITCGETTTKILPLTSRMAYAGGDAGAAIVLSKTPGEGKGIKAAYLNSDGRYSDHMGVPGLMPPNQQDLDAQNYYLTYSEGTEPFLDEAWGSTPGILYKAAGLGPEDIDCFIPHQVHKKRTAFAVSAAKVPAEKTVDILAQYANCGSSTILLGIDHAKKNNLLSDGKHILLVAAGGGISWGGLILKT